MGTASEGGWNSRSQVPASSNINDAHGPAAENFETCTVVEAPVEGILGLTVFWECTCCLKIGEFIAAGRSLKSTAGWAMLHSSLSQCQSRFPLGTVTCTAQPRAGC